MKIKISPPIGRVNWGTGIVIAFAIFMGGTISTAVYLMNQDVNLVADDYYDQEINYQQQIDRMERTNQLENKQIVSFDGLTVKINIPKVLVSKRLKGEIFFYRPSDSNSDIKIPLITDTSGVQIIPVENLAKGYWKIKVSWLSDGNDYFSEERIHIQ